MMNATEIKRDGADVLKRQNSFHHLRFVVISMGGLAMGVIMFLRFSIAVAMVAMVNHTQLYINSHPNATREEIDGYVSLGAAGTGEFAWTHEQQEKIISFYMIGYVPLQYLSTKMITRTSLRLGVCVCIALCALFNALTPVVAYWGWQWAVLLRMAHGVAASGMLPSMVSLIERWSTQDGAAKGIALLHFIVNVFTAAVPFVSGFLASSHWKWAFYIPAIFCMIFCALWFTLIADEPESSALISQTELDLLRKGTSCGEVNRNPDPEPDSKLVNPDITLLSILKIKELYGLWLTWCLWGATGASFVMVLPAYIHSAFQVPVSRVGALASMAQIGSLFSSLWPNSAISLLMTTFGLNLTVSRKITVALCLTFENLSLFGIIYFQTHQIVLLNLDRFFHMTFYTIFVATVVSQFKGHRLSGVVFSIVNCSASAAGAAFCVLVGKFLDYMGDTPGTWSSIFMVTIGLNSMYLLTYTLFCHSNLAKVGGRKLECIEKGLE